MGRLLKNKKIKKPKKMKHQFNRTFHIITPILAGKFSKFTPKWHTITLGLATSLFTRHDECTYVSTYLPTYICTYIHTYVPTYIHTHIHIYTPLYVTSPPRADQNFLTHFARKGGPSIFKWSALSMRSADWNVWGLYQEWTFIHI